MKPISVIVAIAENNAIGKNNKLLVHLPNDLKWFKKNTTGKTILMGRKTFESLPGGALPNRKNIILTRNKNFKCKNCIIVHSVEEALENFDENKENFIIGGAEIYKLFLPLAEKLYITKIFAEFEADTFFPEINFNQWILKEKKDNEPDERNKYKHSFLIYERKK